jgi:N-acetylglucosaminyldiphosphoundecaprenol N-acetyl-beta-D-mannosaminyltransferase
MCRIILEGKCGVDDMKYEEIPCVKFKGVKVSNTCYENVLDTIANVITQKQRGYICLTDVSNLIVSTTNDAMRNALNDSLFSLADGMPLVWFAKMAGCKEIERISGASLLERLIVDLDGCKHYLLGDTEETIAKVIAKAKRLSNKIKISGHSPPFKDFDAEDNECMLEKIREAGPDIIWVCFGGGKQETWMKQNFTAIDSGIMIGVGAAFRFFTGDIITPPRIFQKLGMQWVFRLGEAFIKDPVHFFGVLHRRQILSSKVVYLLNFPREVNLAKKQLRTFNMGKSSGKAT